MHNSLVFKGGEAMYGKQCGNDRLDHVVKQMSISGQQKHTGIVTLVTRNATLMNDYNLCFKSCILLQFLHKKSIGHLKVLKHYSNIYKKADTELQKSATTNIGVQDLTVN